MKKKLFGVVTLPITMACGYLMNSESAVHQISEESSKTQFYSNDSKVDWKVVSEKRKLFKFKTRAEHLAEVEKTEEYDLVVIGGGASGAGTAINAAREGLKTLVIDAYDFSAGTSSKSTKLLHGGTREI